MSALAPFASVLLSQLRAALKAVAAGSVSAATATSFARLVSLVARVFSHADNVAVAVRDAKYAGRCRMRGGTDVHAPTLVLRRSLRSLRR